MSSKLQLDVCCLSCCGGAIWWTLTKERQAWCYLQVKLCDPCLSALNVPPWPKKALYKYSSFPFPFSTFKFLFKQHYFLELLQFRWGSPKCNHWDWSRFYTGRMPFISPNHQWQNAEGNSKQWRQIQKSSTAPHPLLIHQLTADTNKKYLHTSSSMPGTILWHPEKEQSNNERK